jgi:type II secretion system protein N
MPRWKTVLAFAGFSLFAFLFSLYLTFPYEALRQRLVAEATNAGLFVRIKSVGPGFFGVTASGIELAKPSDSGAPAQTLQIQSLSLRPALIPLGVGFRAKLLGGTVGGAVGGLSGLTVKANLDDLNLASGNLKGISGLDLEGRVNGSLSLTLPAGSGKSAAPDLTQASGELDLRIEKALIKGGTVMVPMYNEPVPMDLPRIEPGEVNARVKFDKGTGTVEQVQAKGKDLELDASGTLKLGRSVDASELALGLKLKTDPAFVQRLGMVGAGLSIMPPDKDKPDFRVASITGYLGRPTFSPTPLRK